MRWTVKDGIVYDAPKLLADVKRMVREAKDKECRELVQPWMPGDERPAKKAEE